MIRFIRTRSRILGALAQPILYLVALGFGLGAVYAQAGQGDYIAFLSPGIITMTILFTAVFTGVEIIWDKQFGFLKETLVAPVSRFNIMLGRTLGGATVAMIQGIIVFIVTLFFGFRPDWTGLPVAIVFMFLIALLFSSLGTAIASKMQDMQGFPLVMNFLVMPIYFLSGTIFPLQGIPPFLKYITYINPLSYGVDGMRGALIGQAHFPFVLSFSILLVLIIILTALGARFFARIEV